MNRIRSRPLLASALVYTAATLLMGRDLVAKLSTGIAGGVDPVLNAGILAWNARRIPWTDAWFDFPAFYPATGALTFSEHLLGVSAVATPIYWLTGNYVTTYNVTHLSTYVLCGMAMFALVWRLTGHAVASFLAGFAYAFAPYRASQIAHIQVLAAFWAPLALLGLHAFLELRLKAGPHVRLRADEWRWLALFAVCWIMQGAANGYFLVFFSVLVGFWVLWFVIGQRRWLDAGMIAVVGIVAFLPLIPILVRFVETHARYLLSRSPEEVLLYSADLSSILCGVPRLAVWGGLAAGECGGERDLFPGVTLVALCAAGAWMAWRRGQEPSRMHAMYTTLSHVLVVAGGIMIGAAVSVAVAEPWEWRFGPVHLTTSSVAKPFSRGAALLLLAAAISPALWTAVARASVPTFYLVMAAMTWALTWGPVPRLYGQPALEQGPYAWLMLLPGVDGLRVPARFWMITVLCLCVAMGVLLAAALQRRSRGVAALVAIGGMCGLAADGWSRQPPASLLPSPPRPELLRGDLVLTLPLGENIDRDSAAQVDAIEGEWVAVNGYSGYEPPHYRVLRYASLHADAAVLSPFVVRGDLNVVVDEDSPRHVELVERQPGATLVASANGRRQYRIPRQGTAPPSAPRGERLQIASVSVSCAEERAPLALDGDSSTRWECGLQRAGQEMRADLGSVVTVGDIVPALGMFATDFPRHLLVETSTDGTTWTAAWDGTVLAQAFDALARDPRLARMVLSFAPRAARYVRLRLLSDDDVWYWSIAELEVWSGESSR